MELLTRDFYARDTLTVARALLGQHIVRTMPDGARLVCRITETEAYIGPIDKACHAYGGRRTARTETLYARPGTAYIYFIYGMYHCLNFVTEPEGTPCAVLIRGAKAVENGDIIAENRFGRKLAELTAYQRRNFLNGPGKLCRGLALTREQNGLDLTDPMRRPPAAADFYRGAHRHRLRPGGGPLPLAVLDGGITCTFLT